MNKRIFSSLLLVIVIVLTASAARPKVVAHRGYWNTPGSAQNSIRGLVKADSIKADAVEFDVWLASDDVLMVDHDGVINGLSVQKTPSTELRKIKLANGENMPTVEEFLDKAKDLSVDLVFEIKWHEDPARENLCVKKSIEMVKKYGLEDRTIYITFSPNVYEQLGKAGVPHYFLSAISPEEMVERGGDGPDFHIFYFRKHPDWIPAYKALGMPINIWTVSNVEDTKYCIENDVDYITTDNPELAIKMLAETPVERDYRVMTLNMCHAAHSSVDKIAALINAEKPDFVALQEVDVRTDRVKGRDILTELAVKTGMFAYFSPSMPFQNGYYGNAILSKLPAEHCEMLRLPNEHRTEPRSAMIATYDLGGGMKLNFASTHFCVKNEEIRNSQAEYVTRVLRDSGIPAILAGDLNAGPESEAAKIVNERFYNLTDLTPTYPAEDPKSKIDYILSYPVNKISVKEGTKVKVLPSKVSDHRPIVADVTVKY